MTGEARDHLALALDVGDLDRALSLWASLKGHFAVAKVGLQLFSAAGPAAIDALRQAGALVFADLKLHDIPNTVGRAAERVAARGAHFLTVHAAGGEEMVRAAVSGFFGEEGSSAGGGILAVTVLTSEPDARRDVLWTRARLAGDCGCAGLICATQDLAVVSKAAPRLLRVVPAVRLEGSSSDDQARVATPGAAMAAGADLLVVGRTVTGSSDPAAAAEEVLAQVRLSGWRSLEDS